MKKFNRGYTYLVNCNSYWYIVQQQGQRSWEAVIFSHHIDTISSEQPKHLHNTATGLCEMFKDLYASSVFVTSYNNKDLRQKMFRILKTGDILGWEDE